MLDHETLERGLRMLARTPSEEVARAVEIETERVRLLPAGMLILEEIADRLGRPLLIGRGGLREGVILEHVDRRRVGRRVTKIELRAEQTYGEAAEAVLIARSSDVFTHERGRVLDPRRTSRGSTRCA